MHTDLWNFALNLYARPGVEAACLQWQEQGGDVCLLLCAAWLTRRGVAPSGQRVHALREQAEAWQAEVVKPLRSLRQQWRQAATRDAQLARLREQVKGLELEAERVLLERLQGICEGWAASSESGGDWLRDLAPMDTAVHHDALHKLRVVMQSTQDAEDGV
ncbi:TIGR02444 family protein [Pseudomonas sp. BBP2017]|uniref:TIGR02444 family protein n=1 Tax=Pseudomonas sp. BBP2017 TaxID=2109731 RepID=UPI000D11BB12|nr:TIGR02444 family protein [Pseudomonas sp. BBP2017]PSS48619.1 TIGR02444 family protein [Pseudomonas sp. BBP2017]